MRVTDDLLSCSHDTLGDIPDGDHSGASVKVAGDGVQGSRSSQFVEKVELIIGFPDLVWISWYVALMVQERMSCDVQTPKLVCCPPPTL